VKNHKTVKAINILGRRFSLVFKQGGVLVDGKESGGSIDFSSNVIEIDTLMTDTNCIKALLHEVCHIALDVSGIDQTLSKMEVEIICQTMANTYYDFLVSVGILKA
jgi:hypothetical protein